VGDIAQELLDRVATIGHPEENADITAVINRKSADYIESLVMDAQPKGDTLMTDYRREGNLIHPLVIDHVTEDMKIRWEEPFGPVLPFVRVASVEEAMRWPTGRPWGCRAACSRPTSTAPSRSPTP
jgi:glyceraldehyde-3-phosphate dehydrogenase (NADP+)